MPDSSRLTGGDAPAPARRHRKLGIVLGLLAIILIAAVLGLPRLLDLNRYRGAIAAEIEKATGGKAALGRISWGIATGLWVEADGLSIARAPGFPVDLSVARVSVRLALRPLLSKKVVVTQLVLEKPDVVLKLPGPAAEAPKAAAPSPDRAPSVPPPVTIGKLVVSEGRFRLEDGVVVPGRVLVHSATSIELSVAPVIPGHTATFDLSFEESGPAGLGPFKAHGTLSGLTSLVAFEHPLLSADVSIPALQVEGLKPFLADTAVIQRLSGQVGLTVRYTWDLGGRHTFDGMLDLDQAAYADPSLWDAPLPGTATTVAFRMSLDPGRLTFEQASVKRGPLSVAAHGTLDNLGGAVVIRDAEGTLESPVKDLLAAIPWNAFGPSGPRLREEVRSAERILPDGVKGLALSALISGFPGEPRVEGTVRGPLRVDSAASEEGAGRARRAGWEEVRGAADLDLRFSFPLRRTKEIRVDGRVALRAFAGKPLALPIRLENLEADAEVTLDSAGVSRFSTTVVLPPAVAGAGDRFTLSLAGRVDALSKQAALTLLHLETSPIPLPSASSLVPRESTGAAATAVREILKAGGTLAVEELAFPRTELTRLSRDPASLLPTSKAAVSFSGIVFKPVPGLPAVEDVAGRASLQGGVVTATGVHGRAGALTLPDITIRLAGLESRPRSAFWAKGPLRVTEARNESGRELLRRHGLASLTGSVDVDLHAERDWATAVGWVGGGSLQLSGVRAVTFPAGVVVDKLEGRVTIDRRAALDIVAERLTATVDGAPVRLSGTLRGAGSAGVAVEATAFAKGLDLSRARELFPSVKPLGLEGRLDMDVKVSLPAAGTGEPRLSGGVSTRNAGLRIPGAGLAVTGGDIDVTLSGNAAEILRMSLQLNGQALTATGRIQIPAEPDLRSGGPPASSGPPTLLRRLKASVSVQAAQGRFRGVGFHDLTLGAAFDRGVLTSCDLALGVGSGRIAATGTADLRLPGEVSFVLRPEVTALATESVSQAFGISPSPMTGPLSLSGELRGRAGGASSFLPGLEGSLQLKMGPGRLTKVGRLGALFARILGVASAQRLLSGGFLESFSREGLAYTSTTADGAIGGGSLDMKAFSLESGALRLDARGRIDMVRKNLDLKTRLAVLGVVDKVLGFVPILGRAAQSATSIPLGVKGSFDDPRVRLAVGQAFE